MSSRLRKIPTLKKREYAVADVVDGIAARVESAGTNVERSLEESGLERREAYSRVEQQLRDRGLDVPPVPSPSEHHAGIPHPHEVLCVAPSEAVATIRSFAKRVREIDARRYANGAPALFSSSPFTLRPKPARKAERVEVERTIEALTALATANGLGTRGTALEALAYEHLHLEGSESAACGAKPCERLAVCRAFHELLDAGDGKNTIVVRNLAEAVFAAAGELKALARLFRTEEDLKELASEMEDHLVPSLEELDAKIRQCSLSAPADRAPRKKRASAVTLLAMSQNLERGSFDAKDIVGVIFVAGETDKTRLKNARRRLQRYRAVDFRTRYSKTPDA